MRISDWSSDVCSSDLDAANPLSAPEILLAVDGSGSELSIEDGAAIIATGDTTGGETGDFRIDGSGAGMTGEGALVRVANGDERLRSRTNKDSVAGVPPLNLGASTKHGKTAVRGK